MLESSFLAGNQPGVELSHFTGSMSLAKTSLTYFTARHMLNASLGGFVSCINVWFYVIIFSGTPTKA